MWGQPPAAVRLSEARLVFFATPTTGGPAPLVSPAILVSETLQATSLRYNYWGCEQGW
jgi:hypothetical protein